MTSKKLISAIALSASICLPLTATAKPVASSIKVKAAASQAAPAPETIDDRSAGKPAVKKPPATKRKVAVKPSAHIPRHRPVILAKIEVHAAGAGVPVDTALAVVLQESSFRANVTGAAGEIGLMQLKCQTARGIGYKGRCAALYDPDTNLHYGLRYLRKALNRGSVGYYNAGIYAKKLPEAALDYAQSVEAKRTKSVNSRPRTTGSPSASWGTPGSSDPILL